MSTMTSKTKKRPRRQKVSIKYPDIFQVLEQK